MDTQKVIQQLREEALAMECTPEEVKDYIKQGLAHAKAKWEDKELAEMQFRKDKEVAERDERAGERAAERAYNIRMEELKLEQAARTVSVQPKTEHMSGGNAPKLPFFDDSCDDLSTYLFRFELHATTVKWDLTLWPAYLAALLKGRALEAFREIPTVEAADYNNVKAFLLKRFRCTEDSYRVKFRSAEPWESESFSGFVSRLKNYFNRWLELADVGTDFGKLTDLMVKDQIMSSVHSDLATFLRERQPTSVADLVSLTEAFQSAHPKIPLKKTRVSFTASVADTPSFRISRDRFRSASRSDRVDDRSVRSKSGSRLHDRSDNRPWDRSVDRFEAPGEGQRSPRSYRRDIRCFNCNGFGHMASDCPRRSRRRRDCRDWRNTSRDRDDSRKVPGVCFKCRKPGHIMRNCPEEHTVAACVQTEIVPQCSSENCTECAKISQLGQHLTLSCGHELPVLAVRHDSGMLKLVSGYVGDHRVSVLRDTGATCIGVRRDLIDQSQLTGKYVRCILFTGTAVELPVALVKINSPYLAGTFQVCVLESPPADLIIGNVPGVTDPSDDEIERWNAQFCVQEDALAFPVADHSDDQTPNIVAVQTRAQAKSSAVKPLPVISPAVPCSVTQLMELQKADATLEVSWNNYAAGKVYKFKHASAQYLLQEELLYRKYITDTDCLLQLVLPSSLRSSVLKLAHDSIVGGHMGIARTRQRVLSDFYWPSLLRDVKLYCRSCDRCQRTIQKGKVPKVPVLAVPSVSEPFEKVSVDIVGPIAPTTQRGHRYLLTLVDSATRWPEAIPLKTITAVAVAEGLFDIFSRLGCPKLVLSDQGTQFMSSVMTEVFRLLGIKSIRTSPYHAQSNGMCERLNGTLKQMLRRVAAESPKNWDRYVPAILWSYREVVQESTGFSPFQLLYGRSPRGPSQIFHTMLVDDKLAQPADSQQNFVPVTDFVSELQDRLVTSLRIARRNARSELDRCRKYSNQGRQLRDFPVGSKVLLLLPTNTNKLLLSWKGPFHVIKKVSEVDFLIDVEGVEKVFHANMCKQYVERPAYLTAMPIFGLAVSVSSVGVVEDVPDCVLCEHDDCSCGGTIVKPQSSLLVPEVEKTQSIQDVKVSAELSLQQHDELFAILSQYQDIFTDVPGKTTMLEHSITLQSEIPIKLKPYTIPLHLVQKFEDEVNSMLALGVIEPSTSPYSSPVVLVKKPDGAIRFCIDFRKLNAITVLDAEPIPNPDDLIAKVSKSEFFTKLDLTKGYWQIPMAESSKEFTAFQTPFGLFQWRFMPFGLCNAPATFARLMRMVLGNMKCVLSFFDDVLIYSPDWVSHLETLQCVFTRLRDCGLTVKPAKVEIAQREVFFLGHVLGRGVQRPTNDKIDKILALKPPTTKKQVRSLLGLLNFYRKFVPNFSAIAAPLSNLTKGGNPDKVIWTDECQCALDMLKTSLSTDPVLILPDLLFPFILRTDASSYAVGACLMQERDGELRPVAYAGRKLLPRERNYAVVEREALAVVWAVQKFSRYLYGTHFTLQTDHRPLASLRANPSPSARLTRWSLILQNFNFDIQYIPGVTNVAADCLSRLCD